MYRLYEAMGQFRWKFGLISLLGLWLGTLPAWGQTKSLRFEQLAALDGSAQSEVYALHQDQRGLLWIATTGGLRRFDGHRVKSYRRILGDDRSLPANFIFDLVEGADTTLWLGTAGGGLVHFDPSTEWFTAYRYDAERPGSLGNDNARALAFDAAGTLWVGTFGAGLYRFDAAADTFAAIRQDPAEANSLVGERIRDLAFAEDGRLWIATAGHGLSRYHPETGQFTHYRHDPADPGTLTDDDLRVLLFDAAGNLWVGTSNGLNRRAPGADEFTHFQHDPKDPASLCADEVRALLEDRLGRIWVGTVGGGLCRYDAETSTFVAFRHNPANEHSLSQDHVLALLEDRSGVLWVGMREGSIDKVNPGSNSFALYANWQGNPLGLPNAPVSSLLAEDEGIIWLGTEGQGLVRVDRAQGRIQRYMHDPSQPHTLGSDIINTLDAAGPDHLWVGTLRGGLCYFAKRTGTCETHQLSQVADPNLVSVNRGIFAVHPTPDGQVWVGTSNGGLTRFNPATGQRKVFYYTEDRTSNAAWFRIIGAIHPAQGGRLWVGTLGRGLWLFDPETEDFVSIPLLAASDVEAHTELGINSIYQASDGYLWVGTDQGLLGGRLDGQRLAEPVAFSTADGLAHNDVLALLPDDAGYLWLSTEVGISRFDPKAAQFINFGVSDGLQGKNFALQSAFRRADGELLFGGVQGFNAFYPAAVRINEAAPALLITEATVMGRQGERTLSLIGQRALSLVPGEDAITLTFSVLDYQQPEKNRYAYRIREREDEWHILAAGQHQMTFTHLAPGTHTFEMKGANNHGAWGAAGTAIALHVIAPFWKKVGFRMALAGLFIGLLLLWGRFRLQESQRREAELARLVQARTEQIAGQNAALAQEVAEKEQALHAFQASEARYRRLIEQAPDPVLIHDAEEIFFANAAAARLLGVEHAEALVGTSIIQWRGLAEQPGLASRLQADIAKDGLMAGGEFTMRRADGRELPVEVEGAPVVFDGKRGLQVICRDITERKRVHEALVEAKERAEEMNRLKSAILANMSHEVRTPLTGIIGLSSILAEMTDGEMRDLASRIQKGGQRLLETLNGLLDLSMLESGNLSLQPERLDLVAEVREKAEWLRPLAAQRGLVIHFVSALPALEVYLDRSSVDRILNNLIGNALKFTDAGRITVTVDAEDAAAELRVIDTGRGIGTAFLKDLFVPFKQESTGLGRSHEGSGLGLSIVKQLVEQQGGTIAVESEQGQGTTFIVRWPKRRAAAVAAGA